MKKLLLVLGMFFLFSSVNLVSKVGLDVKTETKDKITLIPVKNGVICYLEDSEFAEVVETGETFSLWIKDVKRTESGGKVTLSFKLELRTPAMISKGKFIDEKTVSFTYQYSDAELEKLKKKSPNASTLVMRAMSKDSEKTKQKYFEALFIGEKCLPIIKALVENNS